jgi:hypothetical protein
MLAGSFIALHPADVFRIISLLKRPRIVKSIPGISPSPALLTRGITRFPSAGFGLSLRIVGSPCSIDAATVRPSAAALRLLRLARSSGSRVVGRLARCHRSMPIGSSARYGEPAFLCITTGSHHVLKHRDRPELRIVVPYHGGADIKRAAARHCPETSFCPACQNLPFFSNRCSNALSNRLFTRSMSVVDFPDALCDLRHRSRKFFEL